MQHAWSSILHRICRYGRNEAGNVGLMVTLALPLLVLSIGGGADYARILAARGKLQSAADSATLATYLHFSEKPGRVAADDLKAYFDRELRNSLRSRFEQDIAIVGETVSYDRKKGRLAAQVKASFPTTFMRLAGIPSVTMNVEAHAQASINYTEVALVLDTTLSMKGAKLRELKRAAKSFLETIHKRLRGDRQAFKVAIVPFAEYVNVGKRYRYASWIRVPKDRSVSKTDRWEECSRRECTRYGWEYRRECHWVGNPDSPGYHRECERKRKWVCKEEREIPLPECVQHENVLRKKVVWEGCVGSRPYPLNLQDGDYATPVPGVMNRPRNTAYPERSFKGWWHGERNNCGSPITPLLTLKDNKQKLISRIRQLKARGYTYIPAGLVWGWRVLSHKAPFGQGADAATVKSKNVSKIIILMTDGANTRAPDRRRNRAYADHRQKDQDYADRMLRELCDNIKATNPATGKRHAEIITVTFDVKDKDIRKLMRQCASLGSFDAKSGQLVKVFDNIARRLVELHLSK